MSLQALKQVVTQRYINPDLLSRAGRGLKVCIVKIHLGHVYERVDANVGFIESQSTVSPFPFFQESTLCHSRSPILIQLWENIFTGDTLVNIETFETCI